MKKLAMLSIIMLVGMASAQEPDPEWRQLFAAVPFQQCVWGATRTAVGQLRARPPSTEKSDIEAVAWGMVLDRCWPMINNDEVRKLVLLHYRGDEKRAVDFRDGMLWFARAYVMHAVVESRKGVTTQ